MCKQDVYSIVLYTKRLQLLMHFVQVNQILDELMNYYGAQSLVRWNVIKVSILK